MLTILVDYGQGHVAYLSHKNDVVKIYDRQLDRFGVHLLEEKCHNETK